MKGGANPSPLAAKPFIIRKRYPFTAWLTETVFRSSDGETRSSDGETHDLPPTFYREQWLSVNTLFFRLD